MLRQGSLLAVLVALLVFVAQERGVYGDRAARVLRGVRSGRVWKTLNGQEPVVIARGGLSGIFPDHTSFAYQVALNDSLPNVVFFCDLQLTQDNGNICRTDISLENSTNIAEIFKDRKNTYMVNGKNITGWFAIDFTAEEILSKVLAKQALSPRPSQFDNLPVLPVEGVDVLSPPALWLNVQYSKFYEEHNLSTVQYVLSAAKSISFEYISSPEVEFLRRIRKGLRKSKSKLVLRFLDKEDIEPSTNKAYGTLLNNLTLLKSYASGILVPKEYIWPVSNGYINMPSTLVQDAHKAGLEVYASDFAADEFGLSYNYSYDPVKEYLQFVDNSEFSVDGVLTDFSVTASEAIACYAHNKKNISISGKPLIISNNGASGDFPGCTDLAYQAAIKDGADYIDCSVQMTNDGVAICRESPDLIASTNVLSDSSFYPIRLKEVSDIQKDKGIFTFNLMWKEIQALKPQIFSPFAFDFDLPRNPAYAKAGQFMTLFDFLKFAKSQANVGVLINIQNARYLASKQGMDVINATITALENAGYGNMTDKVMIQSEDSAVLRKFRQQTAYKLVYQINMDVSVPDSTIKEIKGFADAVTLTRAIVLPSSDFFLMDAENIVSRMHLKNLSVFIFRLRNEYPSLAFDYFSDPTMEISTFVNIAKPDGLFTEFPATANAYLKNACRQRTRKSEYSMFLVEPGALLGAMPPAVVPPPALAPAFTDAIDPPLPSVSVASPTPASTPLEPPLPSVSVASPTPASTPSQNSTSTKSGQPNISCHFTATLVFNCFIFALINWS